MGSTVYSNETSQYNKDNDLENDSSDAVTVVEGRETNKILSNVEKVYYNIKHFFKKLYKEIYSNHKNNRTHFSLAWEKMNPKDLVQVQRFNLTGFAFLFMMNQRLVNSELDMQQKIDQFKENTPLKMCNKIAELLQEIGTNESKNINHTFEQDIQ